MLLSLAKFLILPIPSLEACGNSARIAECRTAFPNMARTYQDAGSSPCDHVFLL